MSMHRNIKEYSTIVFDCDGVILDSNKIKTEAFYAAALPYGQSAAQSLVDFHINNGGISRYEKFEYLSTRILSSPLSAGDIEKLLSTYADHIKSGLLQCNIAKGLHHLRSHTSNRWLIASGGNQAELRSLFEKRGLLYAFDGGIFGSPDTKDEILHRERKNGNIQEPALFIGDSKYDYQASITAGLDFVFLNSWSEVKNQNQWCNLNNITHYSDIEDLINLLI